MKVNSLSTGTELVLMASERTKRCLRGVVSKLDATDDLEMVGLHRQCAWSHITCALTARMLYIVPWSQSPQLYFYIPFPCRRREPPWCYRVPTMSKGVEGVGAGRLSAACSSAAGKRGGGREGEKVGQKRN